MNKKTKICLNSMVGNEEKTISRMLESVAPYIDYWVIQCNGKEDNTKTIIESFFSEKGIPGFTYTIDWDYPGWNRDHTLQTCLKAEHGCDWILRMDADETLHVDEDFDWSILDDTSVDSYNLTAQAGQTKYLRTWFWNAKLPWFFQHDKRHETIHLPEIGEGFQRAVMPYGFRHIVGQDGQTWAVPRKFLRDALELEIDKVVGYKVFEDHYHLWYIAKSYADCYGNPNELPFGRLHSEEYARRAIWYYERFLDLTHDWSKSKVAKREDEMSYFAVIIMGHAHQFLGNNETAVELFKIAEGFCPDRNESLFYLMDFYENLNMYKECLEVLDRMMKPERVNPFPRRAFLIEDRAYVNSSNVLVETKERVQRKIDNPLMDLDSVKFEF
jgi:glycosyltransferase involved in cell wall biosynthesis